MLYVGLSSLRRLQVPPNESGQLPLLEEFPGGGGLSVKFLLLVVESYPSSAGANLRLLVFLSPLFSFFFPSRYEEKLEDKHVNNTKPNRASRDCFPVWETGSQSVFEALIFESHSVRLSYRLFRKIRPSYSRSTKTNGRNTDGTLK